MGRCAHAVCAIAAVAKSCRSPNPRRCARHARACCVRTSWAESGGHGRRCAHAVCAIASVAKSCRSPNPDDERVTQEHVVHGHPERWRRSCETVCACRLRDRVTVAKSCKLPNPDDESVTRLHVVHGHPEPGGHVRRCAHAGSAIAVVAKSCRSSPNPDDEPGHVEPGVRVRQKARKIDRRRALQGPSLPHSPSQRGSLG